MFTDVFQKQWSGLNPNYIILIWTEELLKKYVELNPSFITDTIKDIIFDFELNPALRADVLRICVLNGYKS